MTNNGDIETLQEELKQQTDTRDELKRNISELEQQIELTGTEKDKAINGSVWYRRYLYQKSQINGINKEINKIKQQDTALKRTNGSTDDILSDELQQIQQNRQIEIDLRQTLQRLVHDRTLLEWELYTEEWRLNKESKDLQKTNDIITETVTRLNDTSIRLSVTPPTPHLSIKDNERIRTNEKVEEMKSDNN
ncbi:PREDICTED: uncharacterized protein LOC100640080 [Amphimedon queenslandica]|nr:PREDICTED: uncharacterized protein LOC100640080 [Amphimedon queenslandica]|eukprot:XP_003388303.1 PREDICTED: uncharacterized protein LOC100640080 [Amphimedon queenslandica]